jgi:hypothetical protein
MGEGFMLTLNASGRFHGRASRAFRDEMPGDNHERHGGDA